MRRRRILNGNTRDWPEDKLARFCRAWQDGVNAAGLGERFGISTSMAWQLIFRLRKEGRIARASRLAAP